MSYKTKSEKIGNLIKYAKNSRTHSPKQVEQIAKSITEFGFTNPIIVDDKNMVIAGHGRILAAEKLGIWDLPCVIVTGWSEAQKKAYVIADNKLALNAGWDEEMLSQELKELNADGYDIDLTGFSSSEVSGYIRCDSIEGEDDAPEPPKIPKSKLGDVWILGKHRLMCGDSTSIDAVEKLMDGQKADMVFTDPPYRMQVEGGSNQPIGRAAAKLGEAIKDLCDFDPKEFLGVLPTVFDKNKMNSYVFCNKDLVPDYLQWGVKAGYAFNILFWKKPNAIPLGGQWRPDVEYLLVFRKSAIWNNALKDVSYSKCLEYGRENSTPHPTMKPVDMIVNQVKISSNNNSIVLDLFGGSGSTLIACEKTDRQCYMMELDPHYIDVIINRWQNFTGEKAVHEVTGEYFG